MALRGEDAVPAPDLDAVFQRTNGWIGADADYSIPLDHNRALWLFGDSIIGEVRDGKRRYAKMINNTVAIVSPGAAPQFFYRTNGLGEPAAVFAPPNSTNSLFWPWDGVRTERGLFLFFMEARHKDVKSVWGFETFSAWLALVPNPDDPPAQWKITEQREPFANFSTKPSTAYGWSVVKTTNFVYVYGSTAGVRGATVARAPQNAVDDFSQWRFYHDGQWQEDPRAATAIFNDRPPEGTVRWMPELGQFVVVYSDGLGGDIMLRTAEAPAGPWSARRVIYHCPETARSKALFCYAGKAHPEMSRPGELVVTYAVNSNNFFDLFNDPSLYWPRFVRLHLEAPNPKRNFIPD